MTDEPHHRLVRQLSEARNVFDKSPEEGMADAVISAVAFLRSQGIQSRLLQPLDAAFSLLLDAHLAAKHGNRSGPKPKPWEESCALGLAAAAVTGLNACGWSIEDAARVVGKKLKIDKRKLMELRKNIQRGRANEIVCSQYASGLDEMAEELNHLADREAKARMLQLLDSLAVWGSGDVLKSPRLL